MALRKKAKPEEQGNQESREQVDEMKIVKFESMVEEIDEFFYGYPNGSLNPKSSSGILHHGFIVGRVINEINFGIMPPTDYWYSSPIFEKYKEHNFVSSLHSASDGSRLLGGNECCDTKKLIEIYKSRKSDYSHLLWMYYRIIFWLLFAAAIDDDIYNNELSGIIDLAYCLDFDEHMITDWCRAVEYVLSGNKLSEDCDLQCDTVEGAMFFLHKEDE